MWHRTKYGTWSTTDPVEIGEVEVALATDRAACPGCRPDNPVPHCTTYVVPGEARTYHCQSGSRWFNPATRKMEGYGHCTCDYCF